MTTENELLQLIRDHLLSRAPLAAQTLADELHLPQADTPNTAATANHRKLANAILANDTAEAERLAHRNLAHDALSPFLYALHRLHLLEHLDAADPAQAFVVLSRKLKPLEHVAPADFRALCYAAASGAGAYEWDGAKAARAALVDQLAHMLAPTEAESAPPPPPPPPGRLLELVQQARAYQLSVARKPRGGSGASVDPVVVATADEASADATRQPSLFHDYLDHLSPSEPHATLHGHAAGVKCIAWCGSHLLASGSSDGTVRLWAPAASSQSCGALPHGGARVWHLAHAASAGHLATAAADGIVRLWRLPDDDSQASEPAAAAAVRTGVAPALALRAHASDAYCVACHRTQPLLASGGFDGGLVLLDAATGATVSALCDRGPSVCALAFGDGPAALLASGGKDAAVRLWDVRARLSLRLLGGSGQMGDVSSVVFDGAATQRMLVASKDNSVRLWDLRAGRPLKTYTGHQNTARHFVRATFGPGGVVMSGSDDGDVVLWGCESATPCERLRHAHSGTAYGATWSPAAGLIATCGDDGLVRTWMARLPGP